MQDNNDFANVNSNGKIKKESLVAIYELFKDDKQIGSILSVLQKQNGEMFEVFLTEIRHQLYDLGVAGTYEEFMSDAKERIVKDESKSLDDYYEELRKDRTIKALTSLSKMSREKFEQVLGTTIAKYLPLDENRFYDTYYSLEEQSLIKTISGNTPTNHLLDILSFTENHPENPKFQAIKRASAEYLARRLITENPEMIERVARFLKVRNYQNILNQMPDTLAEGRIGGKTAGIIISYAALRGNIPEFDEQFAKDKKISIEFLKKNVNLNEILKENESVFIGSQIFERFVENNAILAKTSELKGLYDPTLKHAFTNEEKTSLHKNVEIGFQNAEFPKHLRRQLKNLFIKLHGNGPIIIRSSSELEDRKGSAFAGKYKSIELGNSADFETDFMKFIDAIKEVYKSVFSPEVMEYRAKMGLLYADEEMGILIQKLNGEVFGKFFYPHFSAVAMSRATQSYGADTSRGAMILVCGLGETAVEDGGKFVMFANSKATGISDNYRQTNLRVLDLENNKKRSITPEQLITETGKIDYDMLSIACEPVRNDYLTEEERCSNLSLKQLVTKTKLPLVLEYIVQKLKYQLGHEVDTEFTIQRNDENFKIRLVQCRPQNIPDNLSSSRMPAHIPKEKILISSSDSLTSGSYKNIKHLLYINPAIFEDPAFMSLGIMVQDYIAKINEKMEKGGYLILTPRRFGSTDLGPHGIPAKFNHFSNSAGFVEMFEGSYEPSFGTHFFQDVMDTQMISASLSYKRGENDNVNFEFLDQAKDTTHEYVDNIPSDIQKYLKLIDIEANQKELATKETLGRIHVALDNTDSKTKGIKIYIAEKDHDLPILIK